MAVADGAEVVAISEVAEEEETALEAEIVLETVTVKMATEAEAVGVDEGEEATQDRHAMSHMADETDLHLHAVVTHTEMTTTTENHETPMPATHHQSVIPTLATLLVRGILTTLVTPMHVLLRGTLMLAHLLSTILIQELILTAGLLKPVTLMQTDMNDGLRKHRVPDILPRRQQIRTLPTKPRPPHPLLMPPLIVHPPVCRRTERDKPPRPLAPLPQQATGHPQAAMEPLMAWHADITEQCKGA